MSKTEFIEQLRAALNGLSEEDLKKSVDYYEEVIDDRIEDGISEEEAISGLGSIDEIKSRILEDIPIRKIVKEKIKPKRSLAGWEIALLVIGSPVWVPIVLSLIITGLSLYMSFWIIILSLYVTDLSLFLAGILGIVLAFMQTNGFATGLFLSGIGVTLTGVSVLLFFGFNQITKGMFILSKKFVLWLKKLFVGEKKSAN
ncbi:MAG: DUF1700 domain-containing protein [Lachnospiraceae bacterium]|nr:DUF1700 domain-containing protein [Lachnospiraceae bacterium]